ncbi:MAG TPA: hypothetical protein VF159_04715, partial [Gemmatimonadaceae bacterium]
MPAVAASAASAGHFGTFTTHTATRRPGAKSAELLLAAGDLVTSPETGLQYRVDRLLGAGGFGQVFLAR